MKGLRSTDWQLQNSHGDVNYSVGNIVSNTVITMVPIGYWKYQGEHFDSISLSELFYTKEMVSTPGNATV